MKKIAIVSFLAVALFLTSGVALAATAKKSAPVKYTAEQQKCIANKVKGVANPGQAAFDAATKDASKTKLDALKAAHALKDAVARTAAVKAANDAYNNDATVKTAKVPFIAAGKSAREEAVKSCVGVSFFEKFKNILNKASASLVNAFTFIK